ncbi:hypothetical protein Leryth_010977 [Lithospermum erythrorhizon]|nr:hypothetical protein Leryth_010977 [Lithospermum erythrorhizon]
MVGGNEKNNNNGGGLGLKEIPSGSRKMVMSLKEIVNCPEAEIYATLKDCNMDPNEAVNRLLSQDTFREVKSKREKKKESKDTTEGRTRGSVFTSSRGGRSGMGRYGHGGSTQFSSSDNAGSQTQPAYKKVNGLTSHPISSSSAPGATVNTYGGPPRVSDGALAANKPSAVNTSDGILPVPLPSSGYQPAWGAGPGQMSMADIVKMGKPQNKSSGAPNASHHHVRRTSNTSADVNPPPVISTSWPVSVEDEWPVMEPTPAPDMSTILEAPSDSKLHDDSPGFKYDTISRHDRDDDHDAVENVVANHVGSASVSDGKIQEEHVDGTSPHDNDMYQNGGSYQPHNIDYHEVQEPGVSVSSVTTELQQFNIQDDRGSLPEDNGPSVVIPEHLQVQTADCSHLSFGSFKIGSNYSVPPASIPVKTNIGEAASEADATVVGQSEARNSEYYGDESYLDVADGNLYQRAGASSVNYDSPSASQQEPLKPENPDVERENRYAYPTSSQSFTYENTQQPNATSSQTHSGPQMQNNAAFSNVMAYTNSLPSTLLAANMNSGREIDLPYSPFPMNQSMPSKYANSASSLGGSAMSMPEALKNAGYSSEQPTQQSLSGNNVAPGPGIPQHLAMHPYAQHTLPLGPFSNMIGYPFIPPSYTYLPSAYQQAFASNNYNHQSLAALLPHKMSAPVSSLPQSASVASGYGAFGSTTALPGNFPMNQQAAAAPSGTTIGYGDVLSSQYKDNNHLMSLQQNENSAMWLQGPGSRTMSAVPANTYYGMQGQNQQAVGLRQGQQPSQNYGNLGYPDFYHAQAGISMEHQQQNPREGSLGGAQGQANQSQQLWQNGY